MPDFNSEREISKNRLLNSPYYDIILFILFVFTWSQESKAYMIIKYTVHVLHPSFGCCSTGA